jgi:hypothetical protein
VSALTRALVEAIEAPSERWAPRIARARAVVEREYDESIAARRLLELYESVAPRR